MTKMGMRRGECPTVQRATPYIQPIRNKFSSTLTNMKPGKVLSRDIPTLCVITSSPGIGLSDHRPPAGGNQVFKDSKKSVLEHFLSCIIFIIHQ